jgi:3-phenylpropionate/trans-cinnamate dioxygenase ferredoxin subunit
VGDEVFAIEDNCSHQDAALSEGEQNGYKIECWLHSAEFDLRSGQALTPPASQPVKTYPVSVDGNNVVVEI